jgi:MOSC domain-containing protein YiiM
VSYSIGKVCKLFISNEVKTHKHSFLELHCDEKGIVSDKFYDNDILRSVLLSSLDTYELCNQNSIDIAHGVLGENILMDYNPKDLEIGTQLRISEVVLEITQACTICNHLSVIHKNLPELLSSDRGIFAKVIKSGTIKVEDSIVLL